MMKSTCSYRDGTYHVVVELTYILIHSHVHRDTSYNSPVLKLFNLWSPAGKLPRIQTLSQQLLPSIISIGKTTIISIAALHRETIQTYTYQHQGDAIHRCAPSTL
jgi:hypothetical protein